MASSGAPVSLGVPNVRQPGPLAAARAGRDRYRHLLTVARFAISQMPVA
jgi:hypothetical protein